MQADPKLKQFPNMSVGGEYLEPFLDRFTHTRIGQIIRYRATATLWRPQIKQYAASNEGGGLQKLKTNENIT